MDEDDDGNKKNDNDVAKEGEKSQGVDPSASEVVVATTIAEFDLATVSTTRELLLFMRNNER